MLHAGDQDSKKHTPRWPPRGVSSRPPPWIFPTADLSHWGRARAARRNAQKARYQAIYTLSLGTALQQSAVLLSGQPAGADAREVGTTLIISAVVLVMIVLVQQIGSAMAPFKDVVKTVAAGVGAMMLAIVVVGLLLIALFMSA